MSKHKTFSNCFRSHPLGEIGLDGRIDIFTLTLLIPVVPCGKRLIVVYKVVLVPALIYASETRITCRQHFHHPQEVLPMLPSKGPKH